MRRVVEQHWPSLLAGSACAGLAAARPLPQSGYPGHAQARIASPPLALFNTGMSLELAIAVAVETFPPFVMAAIRPERVIPNQMPPPCRSFPASSSGDSGQKAAGCEGRS